MKNKSNSIFHNFLKYYNSLSILKKFLIPSITGFMFFLLFFIFILSSSSYMKKTIHQINTQSIPIYETIFDNEFLLQRISYELHSAVVSNEADWILETKAYADKIRSNLNKFNDTNLKNELTYVKESFDDYYHQATDLSEDLIYKQDNYDYIHIETLLVVDKYNKIQKLFKMLREKLKNNIKDDVNSIYSTSNQILFDSSYAFILWFIASSLGLLYIYKDMSLRI